MQYLSEYLETVLDQLAEIEFENKEAPAGDERAETQKAIEEIRDMIIKADVKLWKKQDITRDLDRIEQAFRKYF